MILERRPSPPSSAIRKPMSMSDSLCFQSPSMMASCPGPLITTADGHYLVKLMETKASAPKPLAAVNAQIRHQLYNQKRARVEKAFYRELKNSVPVRVNQARLEAIELPGVASGTKSKKPPALPGQ